MTAVHSRPTAAAMGLAPNDSARTVAAGAAPDSHPRTQHRHNNAATNSAAHGTAT